MCRRGVVGSAEGREEVVTHQLTAQTVCVHSTGGDKQVLNVHTRTQRLVIYNTLSSQCPHVHTHTSISTHDKVTQVTFTHSRCTNVISSLTSIIGLLSVHSGQWSSYCNGGSASGPDSTGELSLR